MISKSNIKRGGKRHNYSGPIARVAKTSKPASKTTMKKSSKKVSVGTAKKGKGPSKGKKTTGRKITLHAKLARGIKIH